MADEDFPVKKIFPSEKEKVLLTWLSQWTLIFAVKILCISNEQNAIRLTPVRSLWCNEIVFGLKVNCSLSTSQLENVEKNRDKLFSVIVQKMFDLNVIRCATSLEVVSGLGNARLQKSFRPIKIAIRLHLSFEAIKFLAF